MIAAACNNTWLVQVCDTGPASPHIKPRRCFSAFSYPGFQETRRDRTRPDDRSGCGKAPVSSDCAGRSDLWLQAASIDPYQSRRLAVPALLVALPFQQGSTTERAYGRYGAGVALSARRVTGFDRTGRAQDHFSSRLFSACNCLISDRLSSVFSFLSLAMSSLISAGIW